MLSSRLLDPLRSTAAAAAAAGTRTALALVLSACWSALLTAFLLLPAPLNALINALAAASPHSRLYYRYTTSNKAAATSANTSASTSTSKARSEDTSAPSAKPRSSRGASTRPDGDDGGGGGSGSGSGAGGVTHGSCDDRALSPAGPEATGTAAVAAEEEEGRVEVEVGDGAFPRATGSAASAAGVGGGGGSEGATGDAGDVPDTATPQPQPQPQPQPRSRPPQLQLVRRELWSDRRQQQRPAGLCPLLGRIAGWARPYTAPAAAADGSAVAAAGTTAAGGDGCGGPAGTGRAAPGEEQQLQQQHRQQNREEQDQGQWKQQDQDQDQQSPGMIWTFEECMGRYGRVPPLNVLIMVAGTRGDVQPATALGMRLRNHGHRVRLATHAPYRDLVAGAGLEFFPLAGDPRVMMELTVKHRGMLFGDLRDLAWLRRQYGLIMDSCWEACGGGGGAAGGDGDGGGGGGGGAFKPDLLIATAITYGAVHCAEALGVPLHVISTIPWRPTGDICHPWARGFDDTLAGHCGALAAAALPPPPAWAKSTRLGAAYGRAAAACRGAVVRSANWWSTALLDHTAWLGISDIVTRFRSKLGLRVVSLRNSGFALYDLPTTFTFSPSLVPPPRDWGPHVVVSGPLLMPEEIMVEPPAVAETAEPRPLLPPPEPSETAAAAAAVATAAAAATTAADEAAAAVSAVGRAVAAAGGAGGGGGGGYEPPEGLLEFLEREPDRKPLYIGFGSMTLVEGRQLGAAIRRAVAETGVRAVVSVGGWGCLAGHQEEWEEEGRKGEEGEVGCTSPAAVDASSSSSSSAGSNGDGGGGRQCGDIFLVRDVPHTWLFPRVSAVIHHGGVGTTAAGLLAGCPTFVAPSFGDLFFWGELCGRAGVGPPPVPIYKLTAADLTGAIRVLQSEGARDAAKRAGARLRQLDGLGAAVRHIYRGLLATATPTATGPAEMSAHCGDGALERGLAGI
ncbi:hypothetical protein PLESTM_001300200 [Pleodorina starrii]|nr:hypothetical protein PLESTM_001300200 [Pleodorina starrii]